MSEHRIAPSVLHQWTFDLWRAAGSHEREATLVADHLVAANLAGHDSHGVGMTPRYVNALLEGDLQLNRAPDIVSDASSLLILDGRRGFGQSVAYQAMDIAIDRAERYGVCVMGLRNSHHIGRVGHWAEQAVKRGMASVHFTNAVSAPAMVAPWGGAQARYLTNPFTVGIAGPRGEPIVLDFATSAIAHGKVRILYNKGEKAPSGCMIDARGRPTDEPAVMFEPPEGPRGALLPFAAHKGYALAMICELLGAALTGGETTRPENMKMKSAIWNNMLVIVFDPRRLGPGDRFETEARSFIEWVKSAPLSGAVDEILMPGDPERRTRTARADGIPVDSGTLEQLDEASAAIARSKGSSPGPLSRNVQR